MIVMSTPSYHKQCLIYLGITLTYPLAPTKVSEVARTSEAEGIPPEQALKDMGHFGPMSFGSHGKSHRNVSASCVFADCWN